MTTPIKNYGEKPNAVEISSFQYRRDGVATQLADDFVGDLD